MGSVALSKALGTPIAPVAGVVSADNLTFYAGTTGDNAVHLITRQSDGSGLGFFLGGNPLMFNHNGDNRGFNSVMVAFAEIGQGAVILMNANTDIEALENILVKAIGEQYHWPGYTAVAPTHNSVSLNQ